MNVMVNVIFAQIKVSMGFNMFGERSVEAMTKEFKIYI